MLSTNQIRSLFLRYFTEHQHTLVKSSSLVPSDDPTLLFTNAGMVQFKDVFLGTDRRNYARATSSQCCVRAGGKHNDLDNVGYTARHHTFFEMLGNFSFGDYFKREAIEFAWNFLINEVKLPEDKLWVTVFNKDQEAADIWLNTIGIDPQRLAYIGEKDNFWSMGDTGPCGPCSEIFYDHGPEVPGGPPGSKDEDGDRFIEIWNLVFMEYNRDENGTLTPLPKPSVDTGMGLERLTAILQGVHDNYHIDVFQHLITFMAKIANTRNLDDKALRVIADHIRSCSFLILDGVIPANEGRGYVLRRIIRRAVRHGHQLGVTHTFFYQLVAPLIEIMGEAYPNLLSQQTHIESILKQEEIQFAKTLDQGLKMLETAIAELNGNTLPGELVFKLYDTYGFPMDLTADIAKENQLTIDTKGFDHHMQQQRERARHAGKFKANYATLPPLNHQSEFVGYDQLQTTSNVQALIHEGEDVVLIKPKQEGIVILESSPFYGESGGQVGDIGQLTFKGGTFEVKDTQKHGNALLHHGTLTKGELKVGMQVEAIVNQDARHKTVLNHSATHLLHAVLRQQLGKDVTQKGSLVNPRYLRFDFSCPQALTPEIIDQVEREVNRLIRDNINASVDIMAIDEAKARGAMALFGEKYGEKVRMLSFGEASVELCGGTHVNRTGDIGLFKITQETGVAAGIRRIEAITGEAAINYLQTLDSQQNGLAKQLHVKPDQLSDKVSTLLQKDKTQQRQLQQLKTKLATTGGTNGATKAHSVNDITVLVDRFDDLDAKALRTTLDRLKTQHKRAVIVLACVNEAKISLVAGVTDDLTNTLKAGELINFVAQQVGGKGGGRADMAQAGGDQPENLDQALESVLEWVKKSQEG